MNLAGVTKQKVLEGRMALCCLIYLNTQGPVGLTTQYTGPQGTSSLRGGHTPRARLSSVHGSWRLLQMTKETDALLTGLSLLGAKG